MQSRKQPYLTGTLIDITTNSQMTALSINLQEHLDEEDSALGKTPAGEKHKIRLSGSWVKLVQDDFKVTLSVTLYLNRHQPRFSSADGRWEFGSGIRADLTMRDGDQQSVIKMVDVAPCSTSGRAVSNLKACPHLYRLSDDVSDPDIVFDSPTNLWPRKRLPSPDDSPNRSQPAQLKRSCSSPGVQQPQLHDAHPSSTEKPKSPLRSTHQPDAHPSSTEQPRSPIRTAHQPASVHLSSLSQRIIKTSSPSISASKPRLQPVASSSQQKPIEWKTLQEIDQFRGGWGSPINVAGIIVKKKSDMSEQVSLGTCDFKMTLYITDNSRTATAKEVTCNLFWKTEQDCPPWLKADWKVIFLWDVHKRPSDFYHTQLVGRSGSFRWALWAPGYMGSVERLEVGASPELVLTSEQRAALMQSAQKLYQVNLAHDLASLDAPSSFAQPPTVFKQVCDLQTRSFCDVDLCVEIIDIWHDAPGKDRLTVTDYTRNSKLTTPRPSFAYNENAQPLACFHTSNGGHEGNWLTTGQRVISIYVAQPILVVTWKKLKRERGLEVTDLPMAHDLRAMFGGKFCKLCKVTLHFGRGNLYGIMENHMPDEELGEFGGTSLDNESRIVCLDESDPMVARMLEAQETYKQELMN